MKKLLFCALFTTIFVGCTASVEINHSTIDTIMSRRSVRVYKNTPVPHDIMDTIALCGINAPNGMNAQNWEIRIVDNPDFINGATALYVEQMKLDPRSAKMVTEPTFKNMFRNAPTVVFIATKEGGSLIDCGLLAGNMVLAAKSLGIGSVCLGGPVRFLNSPLAKEYIDKLEFSEDYQLVLAIGFGYPDEEPLAKERDRSKIRWIN